MAGLPHLHDEFETFNGYTQFATTNIYVQTRYQIDHDEHTRMLTIHISQREAMFVYACRSTNRFNISLNRMATELTLNFKKKINPTAILERDVAPW